MDQAESMIPAILIVLSLRHTVLKSLKQFGVEATIISEILGYTNKSITMPVYSSSYSLVILKEAIEKLDFEIGVGKTYIPGQNRH